MELSCWSEQNEWWKFDHGRFLLPESIISLTGFPVVLTSRSIELPLSQDGAGRGVQCRFPDEKEISCEVISVEGWCHR